MKALRLSGAKMRWLLQRSADKLILREWGTVEASITVVGDKTGVIRKALLKIVSVLEDESAELYRPEGAAGFFGTVSRFVGNAVGTPAPKTPEKPMRGAGRASRSSQELVVARVVEEERQRRRESVEDQMIRREAAALEVEAKRRRGTTSRKQSLEDLRAQQRQRSRVDDRAVGLRTLLIQKNVPRRLVRLAIAKDAPNVSVATVAMFFSKLLNVNGCPIEHEEVMEPLCLFLNELGGSAMTPNDARVPAMQAPREHVAAMWRGCEHEVCAADDVVQVLGLVEVICSSYLLESSFLLEQYFLNTNRLLSGTVVGPDEPVLFQLFVFVLPFVGYSGAVVQLWRVWKVFLELGKSSGHVEATLKLFEFARILKDSFCFAYDCLPFPVPSEDTPAAAPTAAPQDDSGVYTPRNSSLIDASDLETPNTGQFRGNLSAAVLLSPGCTDSPSLRLLRDRMAREALSGVHSSGVSQGSSLIQEESTLQTDGGYSIMSGGHTWACDDREAFDCTILYGNVPNYLREWAKIIDVYEAASGSLRREEDRATLLRGLFDDFWMARIVCELQGVDEYVTPQVYQDRVVYVLAYVCFYVTQVRKGPLRTMAVAALMQPLPSYVLDLLPQCVLTSAHLLTDANWRDRVAFAIDKTRVVDSVNGNLNDDADPTSSDFGDSSVNSSMCDGLSREEAEAFPRNRLLKFLTARGDLSVVALRLVRELIALRSEIALECLIFQYMRGMALPRTGPAQKLDDVSAEMVVSTLNESKYLLVTDENENIEWLTPYADCLREAYRSAYHSRESCALWQLQRKERERDVLARGQVEKQDPSVKVSANDATSSDSLWHYEPLDTVMARGVEKVGPFLSCILIRFGYAASDVLPLATMELLKLYALLCTYPQPLLHVYLLDVNAELNKDVSMPDDAMLSVMSATELQNHTKIQHPLAVFQQYLQSTRCEYESMCQSVHSGRCLQAWRARMMYEDGADRSLESLARVLVELKENQEDSGSDLDVLTCNLVLHQEFIAYVTAAAQVMLSR